MMPLSQAIRSRRAARGMTLDALAAAAGISKTYLWELENDDAAARRPSLDVLMRIATALGTSLPSLVDMPPTSHAVDLRTIRIAIDVLGHLHESECVPGDELDAVRGQLREWVRRMTGVKL